MPATPSEKSQLLKHFPQLESLGTAISDQYKMYHVDLTNDKKEWINETLIREELAWPGNMEFTPSSNPLWAVAKVTHVSGPTQLWVQFSPENVAKNVEKMNAALEALVRILFKGKLF